MHRLEFLIGVELEAEVIETGLLPTRRDREVDARVFDHPLRVIGFAYGRSGAEEPGVERNPLFDIRNCDVNVKSFHDAFLFR